MGKFVLVYWDLRGLAEPARLMLEYGGIDYENIRLKMDNPDAWFAEKFTLGMDFPNLPYIIDGDVKLPESWAIYRHIGKKLNLFPKSEEENRRADVIQGVIQDIRTSFVRFMYDPDLYSKIDDLRKKQTPRVEVMEKYLKDRKFLLGDQLSYLDFALYETFDHHRLFLCDIFDKSPSIQKFMERFSSIEPVADYLSSSRFQQFPAMGNSATWGGKSFNDKK